MRGHSSSLSLAGAVLVSFAVAQFAPGAEGEERPTLRELLDKLPFGLHGFVETRVGTRVQSDRYISETASMGEARLQLEASKTFEIGDYRPELRVKADLYYDAIEKKAIADLREANVVFSPFEFLDLKLGRQTLTWGTGDLLFINDLFPKDWQAFLIGRDVEYLKAPSDAVKVGLFSELANLNVVFTPRFDADRFICGERISYWSPLLGRQAGRDAVVQTDQPNEWFRDHEWAARLSRNLGGYELAAYGYWGHWKSPAGMDIRTRRATFPRLSVYGGSVRGQVGRGIGNLEAGYYDSREDRGGDDPFVANSQLRILAGYEQDLPQLAKDLTVGAQYYVEWMMDYDPYVRTLPRGTPRADEDRHVLTFRVTKLLLNQNLSLSLFAYYSPTDSDAYLRPHVKYKLDDHWSVEVGGNVFFGQRDYTFFGQFEKNTNVYAAVRYGF